MPYNIIFLGTAGESLVYGKQIRSSGGIILQLEDFQFHIDPGPGTLLAAAQYGINVRDNTAVLVSHAHINHCNDINAVISAMTYSGLDKKGVLVCNKTLINGAEGITTPLTEFNKSCLEKLIVLEKETKVAIEDIEIKPIKLKHSDPEALGYKFFTPKFVLSYIADTEFSKDIIEQCKGSNVLIINVQNPSGVEEPGRLSIDGAVKIVEKIMPKLAIITHFGAKMIKADPMYEAREMQRKTNVQVIAATDGLAVDPVSYSATNRQKTLNLY